MRQPKFPDHVIIKLMREVKRGVAPREHDSREDYALVVAYQNGNKEAGYELVKSYLDVFSVILNKPTKPPKRTKAMQLLWVNPNFHDLEDLFQEILCQFLELAMNFEPNAPFSHAVRATLHQRVFNRYFSEFLETKKSEVELDESHNFEAEEKSILFADNEKVPAQYIELYEAMNMLSKKQREIIEMTISRGWKITEVARELGVKKQTVKTHYNRGISKLKLLMGA